MRQRANLSRLLSEVKNGGEVIITERGKPIVRIVPVVNDFLDLEERISGLERRGLLEAKAREKPVQIPLPLEIPEDWLRNTFRRTGSRNDIKKGSGLLGCLGSAFCSG